MSTRQQIAWLEDYHSQRLKCHEGSLNVQPSFIACLEDHYHSQFS
jgi:hypothetical protein